MKRVDLKRGQADVKGSGFFAYLSLGCLLTTVMVALSACGQGPAPNVSSDTNVARQSAPAPRRPKPVMSTPKLTPKEVTASKSLVGSEPSHAIDGDVATNWGAGGPVPQWIQLDLGEPTTVSKVLLLVVQLPPGPTKHQVFGGPSPDNLKLLGTAAGNTQEGEWLEVSIGPTEVRYLKVLTVDSPSWVAWGEIEIYK
jgi:hypothetical protein